MQRLRRTEAGMSKGLTEGQCVRRKMEPDDRARQAGKGKTVLAHKSKRLKLLQGQKQLRWGSTQVSHRL